MALGDAPLGDAVLDRRGEVEQAKRVGDGRAGPPDARGDLLVGEPEFVDQPAEAVRRLDRVEVLALEVLDERELELVAVGELADDRRDALEAGRVAARSRRSPATSW